jgi:Ca2+:H+ antiporter
MIIVAIGISMIVPEFIPANHQDAYMIFLVVIFILLYVVFSRVQLTRHKYFFEYNSSDNKTHSSKREINGIYHASVLALLIILIGLLSEVLSVFMNNTLETYGLPLALGAVAVAVISASPELITAIRAALDNRMQTVVNIAFGASLATVLLTIPSVIVVMGLMGMQINLALTPIQSTMLGITFFAGVISFNDGETNMLEGFIHVVIFIVFCYLLFI